MKHFCLFIFLFLFISHIALGQKILFVGNSLTYSNDLPQMIETIGKANGKSIETKCLCFPNYGLEDHWNDGLVQSMILKNSYDFVVLQQGPSSQAYGRSSLFEFGGIFAKAASKSKAKPIYYMVWPAIQYYHTFDGVIKNYSEAAEANNAIVAPVGKIWKAYREAGKRPDLYANDQFHPSTAGSFLAAVVLLKTMFPGLNLSDMRYKKFKDLLEEHTFRTIIEFTK